MKLLYRKFSEEAPYRGAALTYESQTFAYFFSPIFLPPTYPPELLFSGLELLQVNPSSWGLGTDGYPSSAPVCCHNKLFHDGD